ncbi:MAG: arylsulfatase A-like enzyme [Phycisphaerales bacterium]|jgi:arylsulfatase A-like enzyme
MNVLFILSDDQRTDTIAAYGDAVGGPIKTPSIDSMVARGSFFRNAYCMGSNSGAVCGPSRAMILTGRSLNRMGNPFDIAEEFVTMPERFRAAGYDTFYSGKWHSGKPAFARGFTHGGSIFFGGMGSHTALGVHDFDPAGEYPNESRRPLTEFSSTEFVTRAVEFLGDRDELKPFFAMVSFTAPHDPRTPPGDYATMYDPAQLSLPPGFMPVHPFDNGEMVIRDEKLAHWPRTESETTRHLADYYGMISHMDAQIGRLLDELDRRGLRESTIIVFASDHGLAIGSHGLMGKQNLYEHSTKAPLIVIDPRNNASDSRGSECRGLVYLLDIFPTVAELADIEIRSVEGRSLAGCVGGCARSGVREIGAARACAGREFLFTAYKDLQRAVRDERWKLIVYSKINRVQLFDLENDPFEQRDLAGVAGYEAQVNRLLERLQGLQARAGDEQELFSGSPSSPVFDHAAAEDSR